MRLPRVRFTVRRMMVAVAIVALPLFAIVQLDRFRKAGAAYSRRAAELEREEAYTRRNIQRTEVVIVSIRARLESADGEDVSRLRGLLGEQSDRMARDADRARRLAALGSKYRRAARHPWLPVAPDPPIPE